jgi:hypothetical protein
MLKFPYSNFLNAMTGTALGPKHINLKDPDDKARFIYILCDNRIHAVNIFRLSWSVLLIFACYGEYGFSHTR